MSKREMVEGGEAFSAAYAALNASQKDAVDTIEGPVMVVAGPGTGKTQILTLRIANILRQSDTQPEQILALTFTESGVKAMRERLRRYVGKRAYRVPIHTFHSFAGQLIGSYPDAFPHIIGGKPAGELDKIKAIETILDGGVGKILRPHGNPQYYVTPLLRIIGNLKQEYITPGRLKEIIQTQEETLEAMQKHHESGAHKGKVRGEYSKLEKTVAKNWELAKVFEEYEALLHQSGLYDFEDMLLGAVDALKAHRDMLLEVQETYQYVLADEHQDVNGTQNELLDVLVSYHEQPNLFVVGDEKQAIYRFQGASLENFLYFEDRFPGTKTIALTENYRSGQQILDAAHCLTATEDQELQHLRVPLTAYNDDPATITSASFSHQAVEDGWVVEMVKKQLAAGVPAKEIAVIVRTNREVEQLATELRKAGIVARASADGDILTHPITASVITLLEAVVQPANEEALFSLLHAAYLPITTNDLVRILQARTYGTPLSKRMYSRPLLEELQLEDVDSVFSVGTLLQEAREQMQHQATQRVVEYLLQQSGLLDFVMTHDPIEGTRVVRRLYDEIENLVEKGEATSVGSVLEMFRLYQRYNVPLVAPYITTNSEAVAVMTAHKAKGLEFKVVIMPHLIDSVWGGSTKRNYFDVPMTRRLLSNPFDSIDDERRLLFVGLTRAKEQLFLCCSEQNTAGREQIVSRLLSDIDETLLTQADTTAVEQQFSVVKSLSKSAPALSIDTDLIRNVLTERGFSATSFNNYQRSPWDYLYRNILRIPEVQAPAMQYGTVIHNVLQRLTKQHTQSGDIADASKLIEWLDVELQRLPITPAEYTRLHERGLAALTVYSEHLAKTLPVRTLEELSVSVHLPTGLPEFPEVLLTGKLDRIDQNEAGTAERVVDYKTGKPKTRSAIEGATKNDDGGYKRQLVFYALLLSLHDDERYVTNNGVLTFVEPDSKGQIKEEAFTITKEEIEALKHDIILATKAIISGEFLTTACDESVSSYCHLVAQLQRKQ